MNNRSFESLGIVLIMVITAICFPRLINQLPKMRTSILETYLQPTTNSQSLWKAREFASTGYFERYHAWPDNMVTKAYPNMLKYEFVQATGYISDTIISIDLIVDAKIADSIVAELGHELPINSSTAYEFEGGVWVLGQFDRDQARWANGFFDYSLEGNLRWIHLSMVRV